MSNPSAPFNEILCRIHRPIRTASPPLLSLSLSDRDPRTEEEREGKVYIETDWRPANGNQNGVQTPVVVGPANGNHG